MKPTNIKKLIAFFMAITGILSSFALHAQIVYTNKHITSTCKSSKNGCAKTHALDLNNDGASDFNIRATTNVRKITHEGNGNDCPCSELINNQVYVEAINDNSVDIDPSATALATAHVSGSDISSYSLWWSGGRLKFASQGCDLVGCSISKTGFWPDSGDRYLGLKIISNGQTYYGWARVSVSVDISQASFTINGYAYESTPNKAIHAGDTGASLANSLMSNTSKKDAASSNLKIVPNPVSSTATITFSLSTPGKVSIRLYDKTGAPVMNVTDQEFTKGIQQIRLNTKDLNAGIYLLQLKTPAFAQTKKLIVAK